MFKNYSSYFFSVQDWYNVCRKKIHLTTGIKIENKLLSAELELACTKQHGVLTYAEYLDISQFGKNGYYATSTHHGKTDVEKRWGEALAVYCQKFGYETIIEFGCGTGELGVQTAKAYKQKTKKMLRWIGVEIDTRIHEKIIANFKSSHMEDAVETIAVSIDELTSKPNVLVIFPYSLDNIPPHVFLNTQPILSYPNALLGVTVKNGVLTERIISPEILRKKGITLKNGFFKQHTYTCDLSLWKLRKGQRAYISPDAFITLFQFTKKFGSNFSIIIIDELRNEPWNFYPENLGTPKSLYEKNLVCYDRARYYRESGKHNLYYPLYKNSLLHFLHAIGFQSVDYDIEQKTAAQLRKNLWIRQWENYSTFAFFANHFVDKKITVLPISFIPQRII